MAQVSSQRFADALVIRVSGRLDSDSSESFGRELVAQIDRNTDTGISIVLDLSTLDYASSSGLNALMLASRQAKTRKGNLYVAELQPLLKEMFEISHLNLMLRIFATVREALAAVSADAVAAYEGAPLQ